jgi:hypothetical protein
VQVGISRNVILQSKHVQLMTPSMFHVTNLTPWGVSDNPTEDGLERVGQRGGVRRDQQPDDRVVHHSRGVSDSLIGLRGPYGVSLPGVRLVYVDHTGCHQLNHVLSRCWCCTGRSRCAGASRLVWL